MGLGIAFGTLFMIAGLVCVLADKRVIGELSFGVGMLFVVIATGAAVRKRGAAGNRALSERP
jgi:hypothetical protein